MKNLFLTFAFVSILTGCFPKPKPPVAPLPVVQPKQTVDVDSELLKDCQPIPNLEVRPYKQGETLSPVKTWMDLYTDCAGRQHKLSRLAADAFNIKTAPAAAPASGAAVVQ